MSTRFYLIPFSENPEEEGQLPGVCPKYISIFPKGKSEGLLPKEIMPGKYHVSYYIVKIETKNDIDFDLLESKSDIVRIWPNPNKALIKSFLQSIGANVSSLNENYDISELKTVIYNWMDINNGNDHLAIKGVL